MISRETRGGEKLRWKLNQDLKRLTEQPGNPPSYS